MEILRFGELLTASAPNQGHCGFYAPASCRFSSGCSFSSKGCSFSAAPVSVCGSLYYVGHAPVERA